MKGTLATDTQDLVLVLQLIKKALKAQSLTYVDLGKRLKMSESGVKKIFRSKDLSFQRLNKICRVLNLSLAELLLESGGSEFEDVSFTDAQQNYFLKNMNVFHFYWKLVYERVPLEEIEANFVLSQKDSFRFLRKLDELHLLELGPNNRIRLPRIKRIRSIGSGPLVEKIYREWGLRTVEDLAKITPEKDEQYIIRYLKVRPESFQDFQRALKKLEQSIVTTAIREMQLYPDKLIFLRWVSASDTKSFVQKL